MVVVMRGWEKPKLVGDMQEFIVSLYQKLGWNLKWIMHFYSDVYKVDFSGRTGKGHHALMVR